MMASMGRFLAGVLERYPSLWKPLPMDRSITYRILRVGRRMWQERLTRPGRYIATAAIATAVAGAFPELMAGAFMFWTFNALLIVSLLAAILSRRGLTAHTQLPTRVGVGSPARLTITVTNHGDRDAWDVGAYEYRLPGDLTCSPDVQYVACLPAGEQCQFAYDIRASRRGSYLLPGPTVVQAFPFGLTQWPRFHPHSHRLLVHPAFQPLRGIDLPAGAGRRYQPGGVALLSKIGESMEYVSNREYRPGDRVRDLHPRSWARVGFPVVKQFQEEFLTRVAIVVDTYVPLGIKWVIPRQPGSGRRRYWRSRLVLGPDDRLLEANLSLAAAVADYMARQDYVVDLFAAGPDLYHFQAGRSLAYLDNILDVLACIERCPRDPFELIAPQLHQAVAQIATVVTLGIGFDQRRQDLVRSLRAAGAQVKAVALVDRIDPDLAARHADQVRFVTVDQIEDGLDTL